MFENQVSTGLSQFTGGANGLVTSANCIGTPSVVATAAGIYAPGCILYQRDSSTGYRTVAFQNTGTTAAPAWTSLATASVVSGSGATVTLTQAQSGSLILMDRAAGIVFTLPSPIVGTVFTFIVTVTVTSNNYKVITSAGTIFLIGTILVTKATDGTNLATYGNGTTHISVLMNGTTTGGIQGTQLEFRCVTATLWEVQGFDQASGTIATPFSTS